MIVFLPIAIFLVFVTGFYLGSQTPLIKPPVKVPDNYHLGLPIDDGLAQELGLTGPPPKSTARVQFPSGKVQIFSTLPRVAPLSVTAPSTQSIIFKLVDRYGNG